MLATGALVLAGCSLITDLSGLSGGPPDTCDGGACSDGSGMGAQDAHADANDDAGADAAPCVPTDVIDPSLLSDAVALAAGHSTSCALRSNGTVACWGDDGEGELGAPGADRPTAATVPGLSRIVAITVGGMFACALDADGHVWGWGNNKVGQLGMTPDPGNHTPAMVMLPNGNGQPLSNVTAIAAGAQHVCAIVAGAVWCWGANAAFQLGRPIASSAPAAIANVLSNPVEIACAESSTCAIADGPSAGTKALYCWGSNDNLELAKTGPSTLTAQTIPVSPAATGTYPVVSAGHGHICARDDKDALRCWGENDFGQLGPNIPAGSSPVPQTIDAAGLVRTMATGDDFTCAIAHDGTTRCLGTNAYAQLGNGTVDVAVPDAGTPPHTVASPVVGLPAASRIASGDNHTCAILARSCPNAPGAVMCWGLNTSGQLGNGTLKATNVPVAVLAP